MISNLEVQPYGLREFLYNILQKINISDVTYWIFAGTFFLGLTIYSLLTDKKYSQTRKMFNNNIHLYSKEIIFFLLIFLSIFFIKWPDLFRFELNPDESFSIVAAMNLAVDPVYCRSYTGGTHGPLVHLPLLAAKLFGFDIDFASARLVGIALFSGTFFFLYQILKLFFNNRVSRLAVLPGVLAFSLFYTWDFAAYNGEYVCVFILTMATYFIARLSKVNASKLYQNTFYSGFILGMVPFSKVQSVPAGGLLGLLGITILIFRYKRLSPDLIKNFLIFIFSSALFTLVYISIIYYSGALNEFWISYIWQNFSYATRFQMTFTDKIINYYEVIFNENNEMAVFIKSQSVCALIFFSIAATSARKSLYKYRYLLVLSLINLLIYVYMVSAAGNIFKHYSIFLVAPFLLNTGIVFAVLNEALDYKKVFQTYVNIFFIGYCVVYSGIKVHQSSPRPVPNPKDLPGSLNGSKTAKLIRALSKKSDSLIVWGWMDYLYIQTGLYSGTKYTSIFLLVYPNSYNNYFIDQYAADMRRSKSPFFIDAVGPGHFQYENRDVQGHETVSKINDIINNDYKMLADIESNRIYVRKERWSEIKLNLDGNPDFLKYALDALKAQDEKAFAMYSKHYSKKVINERFFKNTRKRLEYLVKSNVISKGNLNNIITSAIISISEA